MHKNNKYKRFGLHASFTRNKKVYKAYSVDENGTVKRNFVKTTKKWRKENGVL
jgi:hypothetical protein